MSTRATTWMAIAGLALLVACGSAQRPRAKVIVQGTSILIVNASDEKVPIEIPFKVDSKELEPEAHGTLDALAMFLKGNPDLELIEVQGHTDERGTPDTNLELSASRARSVMDYLVAQGVAASRLRSKGYGSSRPAAHGRGESVWSQNRRVEFLIVDSK